MKAHHICFTAKEKAEFLEYELNPVPVRDQLLVKVEFDVISAGTELANYHAYPNTAGAVKFPLTVGYSTSGRVVAVGPDVTDFKPGDRVIGVWLGHRSWYCESQKFFYHIPDGISMEHAAAAHLLSFPMLGVRKLNLQMGEACMIAGLGLLGQFSVQLARLSGACPVLACDYSPERRALALELGADHVFDPAEPDFIEKVKEITGGGPDAVVEVTGFIPALQQALEYIAWQGRISLLGCTRVSDQCIDYYKYIHRRGITLVGAHTDSRPQVESRPGQWTAKDDYRTFFRYMSSGRLQIDKVIPHRASPRDAEQIYRTIGFEKNPPLGILLDWRDIDGDEKI